MYPLASTCLHLDPNGNNQPPQGRTTPPRQPPPPKRRRPTMGTVGNRGTECSQVFPSSPPYSEATPLWLGRGNSEHLLPRGTVPPMATPFPPVRGVPLLTVYPKQEGLRERPCCLPPPSLPRGAAPQHTPRAGGNARLLLTCATGGEPSPPANPMARGRTTAALEPGRQGRTTAAWDRSLSGGLP